MLAGHCDRLILFGDRVVVCWTRLCRIDHNPGEPPGFGGIGDETARRTMEPWSACLFAPPEA